MGRAVHETAWPTRQIRRSLCSLPPPPITMDLRFQQGARGGRFRDTGASAEAKRACGGGGWEKAAKTQVIVPQKPRRASEDQGNRPVAPVPKPEVRPLGNTPGTPGPAGAPLVTACPAAAAPPVLGTQHRDSEWPEAPCAATEQLRADPLRPSFSQKEAPNTSSSAGRGLRAQERRPHRTPGWALGAAVRPLLLTGASKDRASDLLVDPCPLSPSGGPPCVVRREAAGSRPPADKGSHQGFCPGRNLHFPRKRLILYYFYLFLLAQVLTLGQHPNPSEISLKRSQSFST